jgi:hypothetical protein
MYLTPLQGHLYIDANQQGRRLYGGKADAEIPYCLSDTPYARGGGLAGLGGYNCPSEITFIEKLFLRAVQCNDCKWCVLGCFTH